MLQLKLKTSLLTGIVAAALALSPLSAQAQDTMGGGMMGGDAMGSMNTMGSMAMMPASGTLVRRYTDMEGNVTAVDVQTAMGVRMVRLSPSIPAGDERLRSTYRMGASMSLEGMMVGGKNVPTFDPNAPLQSGLLLHAHSLASAQSAMGAMGGDMAGGMMGGGMAGGGMAGGGMMGGGMTGSGMAGGMMSGGLGSIRALVRLPNGRVTIVKEMGGRLMLVNDGTHRMTDVGAVGGAVTLPASVDKGARVTMVNPDGTMTEMTAEGAMAPAAGMGADGTMSPGTGTGDAGTGTGGTPR